MRQRNKHAVVLLAAVLLAVARFNTVAAETNICLNMIAKNEADEILDCLRPLAPELSGWTLCDTGSTDDTIQVVEGFFDKKGVPGKVANHEWENFGHNRNLCLQAGLEWSLQEAKRQGKAPGSHFCDYLLFLDADQILHLPPGVKPGDLKAQNLSANSYYMLEQGVGVSYRNLRLASTKVEWEWVGEVHEYVHRKGNLYNQQVNLEGYWMTHDASGGKGGSRFVRDEVILSKVVKQRPTDPRSRFYLANTYRALSRTEDAISHYLTRIELGGWHEEHFMSALNIAELAKKQWEDGQLISPQVKAAVSNYNSFQQRADNATEEKEQQQLDAAVAKLAAVSNTSKSEDNEEVSKARRAVERIKQARKAREFPVLVAAYMAASAMLPYRPEPWVTLAKLHRQYKQDQAKCYSFAAAAVAQGPPRADALFLNTNLARYEIHDEMCACAYYVDNAVEEGRMACRKLEQQLVADLLQQPGDAYLQNMLHRTRKNLSWYVKKAPENEGKCTADAGGQCGADVAA